MQRFTLLPRIYQFDNSIAFIFDNRQMTGIIQVDGVSTTCSLPYLGMGTRSENTDNQY